MKLAVATFHVPHPQGAAAGRQLWALVDALQTDGHEVTAWCWGPNAAGLAVPDWCEWSPQHGPRGWTAPLRTLVHPRAASARGDWRPPDDAVRWADDWASWPAVARVGGVSLLTVHYDVRLDARALGDRSPARIQDWRAQRRAVRRATTSVALSNRVAAAAGAGGTVPATVPIPATALPHLDEPVALLFADWSWPANARALRALLADWPTVRASVPGAVLAVAGRGSAGIGGATGVRVLGEVRETVDAMMQATVLAFPCPPTSGPKLKVLDACAAGLPVVTTAYGVEGLHLPDGAAAVADGRGFAVTLADVLADPERRERMAETARGAVLEHHAPTVAARARLAALSP